jgi:hypothetical protein
MDQSIAGELRGEEDHRRALIRTIAAHFPVDLHIGPSSGATCMCCRGAIATGDLQYDINIEQSTITVDDGCYMSSLRSIVEETPATGGRHP